MTQNSTPGVAQVTYQAAWSPDDNEVVIVRDVRAGISGPIGGRPATSRDEAVTALRAVGYATVGEWDVSSLGGHWTDLVRVG